MHPVIGGILERIVPAGGLTLSDGRVIAPGTKVGINPWVLTRNTDIYGADADVFRPERWLKSEGETEDVYEARVKAMRDIDFTFGAGRRVCVGSNVATVEIHKLTATLFSRYDVSGTYLRCRGRRRTDDDGSLLSTPTITSGRRGGGGSRSLTTSRSRSSVGLKMCSVYGVLKGSSVIGRVTWLFVVQSSSQCTKEMFRSSPPSTEPTKILPPFSKCAGTIPRACAMRNKPRLYVTLHIRGGKRRMPGGEDKYVSSQTFLSRALTSSRA